MCKQLRDARTFLFAPSENLPSAAACLHCDTSDRFVCGLLARRSCKVSVAPRVSDLFGTSVEARRVLPAGGRHLHVHGLRRRTGNDRRAPPTDGRRRGFVCSASHPLRRSTAGKASAIPATPRYMRSWRFSDGRAVFGVMRSDTQEGIHKVAVVLSRRDSWDIPRRSRRVRSRTPLEG
jgi:hypothetical protein